MDRLAVTFRQTGSKIMEHRYYPRIAVDSRLIIHLRNNKCIRGISKNISSGGLALRSPDSVVLKKNTFVTVVLMVGGTHVTLPSQVVRTTDNEVALIFIEETSSHKQTLKDWLNTAGVRPSPVIRNASRSSD
jgi:hypothetical protein